MSTGRELNMNAEICADLPFVSLFTCTTWEQMDRLMRTYLRIRHSEPGDRIMHISLVSGEYKRRNEVSGGLDEHNTYFVLCAIRLILHHGDSSEDLYKFTRLISI